MQYEAIDALRDRHAAWRLLRAGNSALILSFLGDFFVEGNRGASSASDLAAALEDHLYDLNSSISTSSGEARFPKAPRQYLEDWAATESGYLRRFYPPGDAEVHYEVTPAFEKAYAWTLSLQVRPFVATESRLHTAVELLRQIVQGTETDPDRRLTDLRRRRDELDTEIATVRDRTTSGHRPEFPWGPFDRQIPLVVHTTRTLLGRVPGQKNGETVARLGDWRGTCHDSSLTPGLLPVIRARRSRPSLTRAD